MPLYTYRCPDCGHDTVEKRDFDAVYEPVACEKCSLLYDGKKHKLMDKNIRTTSAQGGLKGHAGNH